MEGREIDIWPYSILKSNNSDCFRNTLLLFCRGDDMMLPAFVLGGIVLAWMWLLLFRIRRYWLPLFPGCKAVGNSNSRAAVIIPARNEEHRLPRLLQILSRQQDGIAEIIVVDDNSTDRTCVLAEQAAQKDGRLRVLRAPAPPSGWSGKCWALHLGVKTTTEQWILFCDADTLPAEGIIRAALCMAEERRLDALSLIPGMSENNFGAAMLASCMAVARAMLMMPARGRSPGVVQGAFLLVRRTAYEAVGGHEAIKNSLLEDMALGKRMQEAGFTVETHHGRPMLTVGMYGSFSEAWEGFRKHLFGMANFSIARAMAVVAILLLLVLLPLLASAAAIAAALAGHCAVTDWPLLLSVLAMLLMYTAVLSLNAAEKLPLAAGMLVPLVFFPCALLLFQSIRGYRKGAIRWKGRDYKAAPGPDNPSA